MPVFLQSAAFTLLPFALVIMVIVTVHEFGHFLVARCFGVAVDRFAIGFGRSLLSWKDRAGVEWRIGWLPLGGYVKFSGDENAASVPDKNDLESLRASIISREGPGAELRYLHFKPLWQRALIILAGPAANFVLAIVVFAACAGFFGQRRRQKQRCRTSHRAARRLRLECGRATLSWTPTDIPCAILRMSGFMCSSGLEFPSTLLIDRGGRDINVVARPRAVQEPNPFGGVGNGRAAGCGVRRPGNPSLRAR